ncbi:hypothetical protein C8F01DRAFT_1135313 [Mycena amicta]|nr:hypothetical protein C8F01DRAFT_1135313 [Mycena amicta]
MSQSNIPASVLEHWERTQPVNNDLLRPAYPTGYPTPPHSAAVLSPDTSSPNGMTPPSPNVDGPYNHGQRPPPMASLQTSASRSSSYPNGTRIPPDTHRMALVASTPQFFTSDGMVVSQHLPSVRPPPQSAPSQYNATHARNAPTPIRPIVVAQRPPLAVGGQGHSVSSQPHYPIHNNALSNSNSSTPHHHNALTSHSSTHHASPQVGSPQASTHYPQPQSASQHSQSTFRFILPQGPSRPSMNSLPQTQGPPSSQQPPPIAIRRQSQPAPPTLPPSSSQNSADLRAERDELLLRCDKLQQMTQGLRESDKLVRGRITVLERERDALQAEREARVGAWGLRADGDDNKLRAERDASRSALDTALQGRHNDWALFSQQKATLDEALAAAERDKAAAVEKLTATMAQNDHNARALAAAERDKAAAVEKLSANMAQNDHNARAVIGDLQRKNSQMQTMLIEMNRGMKDARVKLEALVKERDEFWERVQVVEGERAGFQERERALERERDEFRERVWALVRERNIYISKTTAKMEPAPSPLHITDGSESGLQSSESTTNIKTEPVPPSIPSTHNSNPEIVPDSIEHWQSATFFTLEYPPSTEDHRPCKRKRIEYEDQTNEEGVDDSEELSLSLGPPFAMPMPRLVLAPQYDIKVANNPARWFMAVRKCREECETG